MVSTNSNINFEKLNFDPFQWNNTLLDNLSDSDFNIFNENLQSINTTYFQTEECSQQYKSKQLFTLACEHKKH